MARPAEKGGSEEDSRSSADTGAQSISISRERYIPAKPALDAGFCLPHSPYPLLAPLRRAEPTLAPTPPITSNISTQNLLIIPLYYPYSQRPPSYVEIADRWQSQSSFVTLFRSRSQFLWRPAALFEGYQPQSSHSYDLGPVGYRSLGGDRGAAAACFEHPE